MNSSRRSLFGLFSAAALMSAGAAVAAPATPEKPKRKYINGKLICGCDTPEWDVEYVPVTAPSGSHTHTISGSADHTHNLTVGWYTKQVRHCIFCGGIEVPKPVAVDQMGPAHASRLSKL